MKKLVIVCVLAVLLYFGLSSTAQAVLITGTELWRKTLDNDEILASVAYYIPNIPGFDTLVFTMPDWGLGVYSGTPDWTEDYIEYQDFGSIRDDWVQELSIDGKMTYLYGPAFSNTGNTPLALFSYNLYYEWDDADPEFDPDNPVSQDAAVFSDHILDSFSYDEWNWTGTPGGNWEYNLDSEGGPYTNPVPEPMTICLLGFGAVLLKRKY